MQRTPPSTSLAHSDSDIPSGVMDKSNSIPRSKRPRTHDSPKQHIYKDEIMLMLTTWKAEQDAILSKLISEVEEIKQQTMEIKKTNNDIEKSIDFINKSYEEMKGKIEMFEKHRNDFHDQAQKLEDKVEDLERKSRITSIEIRGIPVKQKETKEELLSTIVNISKKLNLTMEPVAIRDIYRTKGKAEGERPIVVDMVNTITKIQILQAMRKYNTRNKPYKLNTNVIGLDDNKTPIYISEYLTPRAKRIFFLAREVARNCNYTFCWSANGKVFLRKAEGAPLIMVTGETQLENLKLQK